MGKKPRGLVVRVAGFGPKGCAIVRWALAPQALQALIDASGEGRLSDWTARAAGELHRAGQALDLACMVVGEQSWSDEGWRVLIDIAALCPDDGLAGAMELLRLAQRPWRQEVGEPAWARASSWGEALDLGEQQDQLSESDSMFHPWHPWPKGHGEALAPAPALGLWAMWTRMPRELWEQALAGAEGALRSQQTRLALEEVAVGQGAPRARL